MNPMYRTLKNNLLGVVLCGGESKRMGTDKGSLVKAGKAWAQQVAEKLAFQGLEVVISVNAGQLEHYRSIFPEQILIKDHIKVAGPLGGLLSVHDKYPAHDLLLMACDLIEMDEATLAGLIGSYASKPEYQYYVYRHEGFSEPFCAIYTAAALSAVKSAAEKGELKRFSLHERFETGHTHYLDIEDASVFKNFNHPL